MCFCSSVLGMRGLDRQGIMIAVACAGESNSLYLSNFTTPWLWVYDCDQKRVVAANDGK